MAMKWALGGGSVEGRHRPANRLGVEMKLLGQRTRRATKGCSTWRQDEQAHGALDKRPRHASYPVCAQALAKPEKQLPGIRQAFPGVDQLPPKHVIVRTNRLYL